MAREAAMRILFLTAELGGNVPPTRAVAAAIERRGAVVEIAGLDAGRTALRSLSFPPANAIGPGAGGRGLRKTGGMLRFIAGRGTARSAAELVRDRAPDAAVVDCMALATLRGTLATGVPTAVLFHTVGEYWLRRYLRGPGALALRALGVAPGRLWGAAAARLVLTDPELDPASSEPRLARFAWLGTTEQGGGPEPGQATGQGGPAAGHDTAAVPAAHAPARPSGGGRPRVLVALSSSDWPGMLPVYRRIVEALAGLPVDALVTTGGVNLGGELHGAPNVAVRGWVPHHQLLPRADLLVGHGGHSTTFAALACGVPALVLPINPISDQRLIGALIESAGLGRTLARQAGVGAIRATIAELLASSEVRAAVAATAARLGARPPAAEAAAARVLAIAHPGAPGAA